jgi:hypothetical protein
MYIVHLTALHVCKLIITKEFLRYKGLVQFLLSYHVLPVCCIWKQNTELIMTHLQRRNAYVVISEVLQSERQLVYWRWLHSVQNEVRI